jgi:hypothetical protein
MTHRIIQNQNGFLEAQCDTLDDAAPFLKYFADDLGFVFRGQADSTWKLETSLDRLFQRIKPTAINLDSTYDFLLNYFIRSIRGRTDIPKDPDKHRDEIWALGQHNGLATPLLDWTKSFHVGLFFAFVEPSICSSGYRSVWAIHADGVNQKMQLHNSGKDYKDTYTFIEPITDHNPRLIHQAGLFTKQPIYFDPVEWIQSQFKGESDTYLFKLNFPDAERIDILSKLRLMNVHSATLFPDVLGASMYCNETLELYAEKRRRDLARAGAS